MEPTALAALLQESALGAWVRGGGWTYAIANVAHLVGLVLLVGPILLLDLRVLGAGAARFALGDVLAALTPFAATGLALALASGMLLFAADAVSLWAHPLMRWKLAAVALGLANIAWFRGALARGEGLPAGAVAPAARLSALASIVLWTGILAAGRMIAYV